VAYEYILLEVDKLVHFARQEELKRLEEVTKKAEAETAMALALAKKAEAEHVEAQAKADIAVYRRKRLKTANSECEECSLSQTGGGKVRFVEAITANTTAQAMPLAPAADPFSDLLHATGPAFAFTFPSRHEMLSTRPTADESAARLQDEAQPSDPTAADSALSQGIQHCPEPAQEAAWLTVDTSEGSGGDEDGDEGSVDSAETIVGGTATSPPPPIAA
jgi:hypothetical protein